VKPGDKVQTHLGIGELVFIGGKPPDTVNPDYPDWKQQQMVVVLLEGVKRLFAIDEVTLASSPGTPQAQSKQGLNR